MQLRPGVIVLKRDDKQAMHRDRISSSSIRTIGCDLATQTLEVEYANGTIYQYFDVSSRC